MVPDEVAAAWGWSQTAIAPHLGGLINKTFVVRDGSGAPLAALQQLHPIFTAEVNLDIDAVTSHLAARGFETPRIIRVRDGQAWVVHADRVWRALTWVEGESVHAVPSVEWAEAGGRLVGRFHRAVADLEHNYKFTRAGVHDTAAHLDKLRQRVKHAKKHADDTTRGVPDEAMQRERATVIEAVELGSAILAAADQLPQMPTTPRRHVHGDLKISNLIFRREPLRGVCLVDLDTVGRGTMAFELGDAMRSWCNPLGEDVAAVKFDLPIFAAAVAGFRAEAERWLSPGERTSVVIGLETVCIELAARFAVDVFDDSYFGWDPARFPSRRAHNLVRARGQLALGLDVRRARSEALATLLAGT